MRCRSAAAAANASEQGAHAPRYSRFCRKSSLITPVPSGATRKGRAGEAVRSAVPSAPSGDRGGMAEPSSQSPPPEVNGGSAGGSRRADGGGGGGGAREQSLDLLPHGDRPTLLQLMSDPDYQQTQLGAAFKPSKQLKKGRFWCLVASHMQKPLPSVMLTGMHLRAGAPASRGNLVSAVRGLLRFDIA